MPAHIRHRAGGHLAQAGGIVLDGPQDHHQRRVALEQAEVREVSVVLAERIGPQRIHPERRVLERMRVLVGVGHPRLGVDAGIGDHHHPLADRWL